MSSRLKLSHPVQPGQKGSWKVNKPAQLPQHDAVDGIGAERSFEVVQVLGELRVDLVFSHEGAKIILKVSGLNDGFAFVSFAHGY